MGDWLDIQWHSRAVRLVEDVSGGRFAKRPYAEYERRV